MALQVSVVGSGVEHEAMAERCGDGNPWVDYVVATGIGHARNLAVVASGAAVIAVGGSWGTLSEIALARRLGRTVVILEPGLELPGVMRAATPAEAVELALEGAAAD
jgi:uncharacterized protein (TIGR00725 family)